MKKSFEKLVVILLGTVFFAPSSTAQTTILGSLDFDPAKNGFSFKNYANNYNTWKDDMATDDLIRMFGVKAVCKSGSNAKTCVPHASTRRWIDERLKQMEIGHCEGIAVASLRLNSGLTFKGKRALSQLQPGAKSVFGLKFDQEIQNYISYYWITQIFPEIKQKTENTAKAGPAAIVHDLAESMKNHDDTYLLGMRKFDPSNGRISDGHAVAPFKVEDTGNQFKISVYDNNFPGTTRYVFVNKTAGEEWYYSSKANAGKPDYSGNKRTQTLDITATSWRDGICFGSSFEKDYEAAAGCGDNLLSNRRRVPADAFRPASFAQDADGEQAEFFLTDDGDMLVVNEAGRRLGYDPRSNRYYREISGSRATVMNGGLGLNVPNYTVPFEDTDGDFTIVFSGKYLDQESDFDFVYSAPGFTVGFEGILLDPNEILVATISYDGEEISFTASRDGETPNIFYAFDADDDRQASYLTEVGGVDLTVGKTLAFNFDFENGKLFMSDNDGNEDEYDIELTRLNVDGSEQVYKHNDLDMGKTDMYEMDFGDWDGKGPLCFKDDDDGDGFDDEECEYPSGP